MNVDSTDTDLIGFEGNDATNTLLARVGVESDLGRFLAAHLRDVLRQQYADLSLDSLRLMSVGECTVSGQRGQEEPATAIASLTIPFAVEAFVTVQEKRYRLELGVTLRATAAVDEYEVESDVVIQQQSRM